MGRLPSLLICDDELSIRKAIQVLCRGMAEVSTASAPHEALDLVRARKFDLVLWDLHYGGKALGIERLPEMISALGGTPLVVLSGSTDFATVMGTIRTGARDYISKDAPPEEMKHAIRRALSLVETEARANTLAQEVLRGQNLRPLIGKSPAIAKLQKDLEKIRRSDANVLITGETGTGKEVVSHAIRGAREDGTPLPWVSVDSATIQNSMAESLLFGHEKGAFTGAERAMGGLFEAADGGALYFDELGNMPLDIQSKLLRVLQEKEVRRLGSSQVRKLEFRVIGATNIDLEQASREGKFRLDLLQRIAVIHVQIPPLRERVEDLPLLLEHHVQKRKSPSGALQFSPSAIEALKRYAWPGNIRELENLVANLATFADRVEVEVEDLPARFSSGSPRIDQAHSMESERGLYEQVAEFERSVLEKAWSRTSGNVSEMSRLLRMDRSHLYDRLKKHGIARS